jgi:hypothetical protein
VGEAEQLLKAKLMKRIQILEVHQNFIKVVIGDLVALDTFGMHPKRTKYI